MQPNITMRTGLTAMVAAVALAAPAAATADTGECVNLASCAPVVSAHWVVVSPPSPSEDYSFSEYQMACPASQVAAGHDYEAQEPGFITRLIPSGNAGTSTRSASFLAINGGDSALTYRPHVGCIPEPPGGGPGQDGGPLHVVKSRRLQPDRVRRFVHRCPAGGRLLRSAHAIALESEARPAAREAAGASVRIRNRRSGFVARVRTSRAIGNDERAVVQLHAHCTR